MDVSKLIWALVIAAVVGGGWLLTSGGVNWQLTKYTEATPGEDADRDELDEAGLSKLGGFLLTTFRYEKAKEVYDLALDRYPDGKNIWWNLYQLARCEERLENYQDAVNCLVILRDQDGDSHDERVPNRDNLELRIQKLVETHELPPV